MSAPALSEPRQALFPAGVAELAGRYDGFLLDQWGVLHDGAIAHEGAVACLEALRRIARKDPKGAGISVSFVALDKNGRYGAAGSAKGFPFAVTTATSSRVLKAPGIGPLDIGPEGGNRK